MSCSEIYTVTSNRCKFAQQNDPQCNCEKAFCVYDTGNKNDISHADICQATSSRVYGSKMRLKLREIFSDTPITLDILFTN
jgi:hypothetical protein